MELIALTHLLKKNNNVDPIFLDPESLRDLYMDNS